MTEKRQVYYEKNKEQIQARQRQYYKDNPDKWRKYRATEPSSFPIARMLQNAKRRARERNLPFNLTPADIVVPEVCPVLGLWLSHANGNVTDHSPSLDRIIQEKGYVRGNVIVVSYKANRMKSNATVGELRKLADFYEALVK